MKLIAFLALFALPALAFAALPVNATVTAGATSTLVNNAPAGTVSAWGGNVTSVNVNINSSTLHWQGFYGNITGSLALAAGADIVKYWSASNLRGQIYASTGTSIDFTLLNSTSVSLSDVDSTFSFLSGASDSAQQSGSNNANSPFNISSYQVAASSYPAIKTRNATGSEVWETVVLNAGNTSRQDRFVFAGIISQQSSAFDGSSADFQLIVPENSLGDLSATTYYFYGEIR